MAAANRHGHSDWVVPSDQDINATRDDALASGPLGGFVRNDGNDGNRNVNFATGEAFVGGAYIASDDDTVSEHSVLVPSSSTTTIYLGWDLSTADTLIIGPASDFGANDPKVELWEFTTDSSSITSDTDLRTTSASAGGGNVILDTGVDTDDTTSLSADTGTIANPYPQYEVVIARECDSGSENYMECRVNGISSGDYYYDFYDSLNNGHSSQDGVDSFGRIAGTDNEGAGYQPAVAFQTIKLGLPTSIGGDTTQRTPLIWTPDVGVGKNIDYIHEGNVDVDADVIDRVEVFGGDDSTGRILIRGIDPFQ
jgi:hypothetical protein